MDNTSSGSAERPAGWVSNGASVSGEDSIPSSPPHSAPPIPLSTDLSCNPSVQSSSSFRRPVALEKPNQHITVVVHKDGSGYGMKVSGDNPVYVQSVKAGGAAERAGLHSGDKIIKVNGINVTQSSHTEVVELIKSEPQVVLTVQQLYPCSGSCHPRAGTMPASSAGTSPVLPVSTFSHCPSSAGSSPISPPTTPGPANKGSHHYSPLQHHHINKSSIDRITGPQPVDHEKLRQLEHERVKTFQLMLEKERSYVDRLRSELAKGNDAKKSQELANAERRVRTLRQQLLMALSSNPATSQSSSVASPTSSSADHHEYQVPSYHHHYHPLLSSSTNTGQSPNSPYSPVPVSHQSVQSTDLSRLSSRPPPLPSRNRPVSHESPPGSSFLVASSSLSSYPLSVFQPPENSNSANVPPPLPPRTLSSHIYSQLQCNDGVDTGIELIPGLENLHKLHKSQTNRCQSSVPQTSQSSSHTHQRAKSSPDPLSMVSGDVSKSMNASGSVSDLSLGGRKSKSGVWESDSPRVSPPGTPPGTPPPPYGVMRVSEGHHTVLESGSGDAGEDLDAGHNHADTDGDSHHQPNGGGSMSGHSVIGGLPIQPAIIAMEDDEMSDQEVEPLEDHGPFKSLSKLWEHNAHIAVFLNYLMSNSDPSSLLFYLLTDLYKEGNAKEMRKWAYEIYSIFLVPGAPLRLNNVDENVAREVDEVLLYESDKEEILRKAFWKARVRAKEELNEQLDDFQKKRTAGLGTLFGPSDSQLDESMHDKNKEARIIETIVEQLVENCAHDIEADKDARRNMIGLALVTVAGKTFGYRSATHSLIVDKNQTFVSKEKSSKSKFSVKPKKLTTKGHNFVLHQYHSLTHCNNCGLIIWGFSPQGYQCTNCQLNIHRQCTILEESCAGPLLKKERTNDRISKLMEIIRPEREARRKPSSLNSSQIERARRHGDEHEDGGTLTDGEPCLHGDKPSSSNVGASGSRSSDRRPDPVKESEEHHNPSHHGHRRSPLRSSESGGGHDSTHHTTKKSSGASINRSESYKERVQKRQLRERRKTSDPNLSKTNDVDLENQGLSYHNNSGSSSNSSSISSHVNSLDSPCNSLEMVTGGGGARGAAGTVVAPAASYDNYSCNTSGAWLKLEAWNDSDTEAEPDPPDWTKGVPEEVLRQLTPREKKRQDVINELFHTERSHVRNLKVLDRVFYRPMLEQNILPIEQVHLLFSNLEEMLEIHSQFNGAMKAKRRENPVVERVGDILLNMLDGQCGENFEHAAAKFCARQQIALESLKESRRKDGRLNSFLTDAEAKPVCRRLQLKDIIPTGMLRLTKYPLLFESLAKYTDDDGKSEGSSMAKERSQILRALERSKKILDSVNQAVREAEDEHRLQVIQQKLEKTAFEKADHPMSNEFKNLDLTKYRLVYEGALSWRAGNRSKTIDLHVVLLEEIVILLQKQDDKFVLRFHSMSSGAVGGAVGGGGGSGGRDDSKHTHSPIIKLATVLVRPVATDKRAFFLVNTSVAQIYELVAVSSSERKKWFRHISEAAEAYKVRDAKNRRPDPRSITPPVPLYPSAVFDRYYFPPGSDAASSPKTKDERNPEENGEVPSGENAAAGGTEESVLPVNSDQTSTVSATSASTAESEAVVQKTADGKQPSGLEGGSPQQQSQQQLSPGAPAPGSGTSPAPSPGTQRRGISGGGGGANEPLRLLTEESPLIQPSEVVVSQRAVLTAQPVLTPLEKLRRKDEMVIDALLEKHLLVADLLHVPHEEFDSIADMASEPSMDRDVNELLLASIHHADQLMATINETLRVTEEEAVSARSEGATHTCGVPAGTNASGCSPRVGGRRPLAHRMPGVPVPPLLNISSALCSTLSLLMKHVKEREEERDRLRRELQRLRELIHARNQNEQRLQWHDSDLVASDSATEANVEFQGEEVEECESGVQGLDLRASVMEGDETDAIPTPQLIPHIIPSLQTSDGQSEEVESEIKGKLSGESADDPGGDVYVDALPYGDTDVSATKEQIAEGDGEIERDSLECKVEPAPLSPASKDGTDTPDNC